LIRFSLAADLKTALPLRLHFISSDKFVELVRRGGGLTDRRCMRNLRAGQEDLGAAEVELFPEELVELDSAVSKLDLAQTRYSGFVPGSGGELSTARAI
jgi:hypothetical protein